MVTVPHVVGGISKMHEYYALFTLYPHEATTPLLAVNLKEGDDEEP